LKPQDVPSQVGVAFVGAVQTLHEPPHSVTLVNGTQVPPPQSW
jgi:hypothetical protein